MAEAGLQAALPREMYVDQQTWLAERETVLFGQWYCLGRVADLGLDQPERVVTVDVVGESVLVTSRPGRPAARVVQRLPPPRLPDPARRRRR